MASPIATASCCSNCTAAAALSRTYRMQPVIARATSSHQSSACSTTLENLTVEFGGHGSRVRDLKEVMTMMNRSNDDGGLVVIDSIQRLALDHHFNEEIHEMLHNHHNRSLTHASAPPQLLHQAALSFRLLRQHGYCVPPGRFGILLELQDLAKLDFNRLQSLHQSELQQVSRWWKELGLSKQLGFVRDQPMKWCTWSLALIEDPNLSSERWRTLCNAFLVEAKWYHLKTLPGSDEYLENGIISSGVHVAPVHLFFLLGQNLNKNTMDQIDTNPGIISSAATILRLWDDLGSSQDEDQEGNDGSYIECYLKEHDKEGAEEAEQAKEHVRERISDAWKRLNRECLHPNPFASSSAFVRGSLNLARMVPLLYDYDQEHNLPHFQEFIKPTLFEPAIL